MSEVPPTLTRSERDGIDDAVAVEGDVVKPVIALIGWGRHLHVLLASNFGRPRNVPMLINVQSIRIPTGWKLTLLRFFSRFAAVHLPDEFLYERVVLMSANDEFHCAIVSGEHVVLAEWEGAMFPVRPLRVDQYQRLIVAKGRDLLRDVLEIFQSDLATLAPQLLRALNPIPSGGAPSPT